MARVDLETSVRDIIRAYPEAQGLLVRLGFDDFANDAVVNGVGAVLKLSTALRLRQVDAQRFLSLLEAHRTEASAPRSVPVTAAPGSEDAPSFLALMPCPLKVPFEAAFLAFLDREATALPRGFRHCVEANTNQQLSFYEHMERFSNLDDLPDVFITPGLNSFFHGEFVNRYVNAGDFVDVADYALDGRPETRYRDPEGRYTMLCVNVTVMVVDHTRLEGLPVPETWETLLLPEWERRVVIRGEADFFCETVLLSLHQQYGLDGIRRFGRSVAAGWHPAEMVKAAGKGLPGAPAVSVMPYFFARKIKPERPVSIVWPRDGAIVSPVTLLAKREHRERLAPLLGFLTGPEVGQLCADAFFPSPHPKVDNRLTGGANYRWLGWDYIKTHNIGALVDQVQRTFREAFAAE